MFEIIAALLVFGAVVIAMSIGVIFGNRPLKGSCGGLNNLKKLLGITPCLGCHNATTDCPLRQQMELRKHKAGNDGESPEP
jgi:hypothetical protein